MVKFKYSILYVEDVERSVLFYEKSFGFTRKFITPENDYSELNTGEITLSFASLKLATSNLSDGFITSNINEKPFAFELAFETEDVENTVFSAIENGATMLQEPTAKPWGQTVAYVRDINGFLIEICSPINL